jgi:signal transduction histidine kinase
LPRFCGPRVTWGSRRPLGGAGVGIAIALRAATDSSIVVAVGRVAEGRSLEARFAADWRPLVLKRTSRLITVIALPATAVVALAPSPFSIFDRIAVFGISASAAVVAVLSARDVGRTRLLAAVLVGSQAATCLAVVARVGLVPGLALALGGTVVMVAIFFGSRAVWWAISSTTVALLALGLANRAGWLHPTNAAQAFDWSKMSVWVRVSAGYAGAMSVAASAVATVIAHLEQNVRERDRLLAAEREAIHEGDRALEAERRARERLGRLQQITASLSRASTPEEVIDVACRTTCQATVGQSAVFWTREDDGALRLAGSWGPPLEYLGSFQIIPASANLPVQQVARTGIPMWVETEEDYRSVSPGTYETARAANRLLSFCIFALAVRGAVKGVIVFGQPLGHRFDDDERSYYTTLSLQCAYALERATLHAAARDAADRAEMANRLKDEFLSTVSHELRTPLNAIVGWVQILRSGRVPADQREQALQIIDRNAATQAKLIADLLDVSWIRAGHARLDLAPVDPAVVLQMAVESIEPAAVAKGVEVRTVVDGSEVVLADAARLQQVVSNLLTNSVKFSARGGVVDVILAHEPPDVVITVRDKGEGIRPSFLPHLFEPFRQADPGLKRSHGGLGIGLKITKKLVELHGGTIEGRSDGEGQGATFVVRLPSAAPREDALAEASAHVRAT